MGRRRNPRREPPPVVELRETGFVALGPAEARVLRQASERLHRVPDARKHRRLSRAERRAQKERQLSFESIEAFPQFSDPKEGK